MGVHFRHGPYDGKEMWLLVPTDTIVVADNKLNYYYLKTPRQTNDNLTIFQFIGNIIETQTLSMVA